MKTSQKIIILLITLILIGGIFWYFSQRPKEEPQLEITAPKIMKLTSPVFEQNQFIPKKYTCDGEDINPPLEISGVPEGTKSLVLIVDDPDAPMGTWDHWIIWNINPATSQIEENNIPEGSIQGMNDFGKNSYGGPCPPLGTHHYHFKLYALNKTLELTPVAKKEDVEKSMEGSILAWAELIGLYQRK